MRKSDAIHQLGKVYKSDAQKTARSYQTSRVDTQIPKNSENNNSTNSCGHTGNKEYILQKIVIQPGSLRFSK
jgi:hypothetical protein